MKVYYKITYKNKIKNKFLSIMDTSSEIKDSMMFPEKPLRKFGNRRFCCNGRCSILTNCVGLPLTVLMSIYSIVQILYFINKFITISSSIRICFFISHIAMFFLVLSQTLIVSLSNSGFFYPKKEILSSVPDNSFCKAIKLVLAFKSG